MVRYNYYCYKDQPPVYPGQYQPSSRYYRQPRPVQTGLPLPSENGIIYQSKQLNKTNRLLAGILAMLVLIAICSIISVILFIIWQSEYYKPITDSFDGANRNPQPVYYENYYYDDAQPAGQ